MDDRNIKSIKKILDYTTKILSRCEGMSEESFLGNDDVVELCAFSFIQIGEYVNALDDGFTSIHDTISWHEIRGLRNRIVHDYEGIDRQLVWRIIRDDLPDLIRQLGEIINPSLKK